MDGDGGAPPARRRTLVERMIGAALLDVSVYEEVEHDRDATAQAAIVVAIVAVCGAIGQAVHTGHHGGRGPVSAILGAFVVWLVMSALTYFVGTQLFGGTADWGELLRTLGFAQSPGVLAIAGVIPLLGGLVLAIVAVWQLVTAVVGIRQALDFDTGKAVATGCISWLIAWGVVIGMAVFVFGSAMILTGALSRH